MILGFLGPVDTSAAVYRERSPLYHIEKFNCPIVLFQGLEDRVSGEVRGETQDRDETENLSNVHSCYLLTFTCKLYSLIRIFVKMCDNFMQIIWK